jgi:hypothetical protein
MWWGPRNSQRMNGCQRIGIAQRTGSSIHTSSHTSATVSSTLASSRSPIAATPRSSKEVKRLDGSM